MSDALVRLYHSLPVPLRTVGASLRGLYLRSWRYGRETDRLKEEALERDHWSYDKWKNWQEERLSYVLNRAATRVPYYQEQWLLRRRRGDNSSCEYLENWPILKKEPLRRNPRAFVADDRDIRKMYCDHTSGTTGTPLTLWWTKDIVRAWFALFEARARLWNGVSRHENWATLGGQPVVAANAQCPPFWVWNAAMNQLYLSANHISRKNISAYVGALHRYRITHLLAYSSSATVLAREAIEQGLNVKDLKVVLTIAEPLTPWQRDTIRKGLGCEIKETYGMGEIVAAATECFASTLHLWPEIGWSEVLSDAEDVAVPRGASGRLIMTGLLNTDMPLIRYAVGDRGSLAKYEAQCECRRTLPAITGIEGRTNDLLIARDGRRVYWLNPAFYGLPIREAQIIQETVDCLRVRYVPAPEFTYEMENTIQERLRARMGKVEVSFEQVDNVPRSANGKFRAVINQIASHEY